MGLYILFSLITAQSLVVSHNYSVPIFILSLTSGQSNVEPEGWRLQSTEGFLQLPLYLI